MPRARIRHVRRTGLPRRGAARTLAASLPLLLLGCPWPGTGPGCRPIGQGVALPEGLEESSGVAASRAHPGVFWTHDDGREPWLFAVDSGGGLIGRVRLEGAELVDWEDLELAACGTGDCLYVGDVGDNLEQRDHLRVHRLPEPDPRQDSVASVETLVVRLPDGPRDVEALFVLPGERLHLVSKGRADPVSVYRHRGPLRFDTVAVLEEVQRLSDGPRALPRQVTGASASPAGDRIAVRTYETLTLYRVDGDTLAPLRGGTVNLRPLREPQGEGVAIGEDGLVALTSEAGPLGRRGSMVLLRCRES